MAELDGRNSAGDYAALNDADLVIGVAPTYSGFGGLIVDGRLKNCNIHMVVDTGSSITMIHPKVISQLGLLTDTVVPITRSLKTVTGQKIPIIGQIKLPFETGSVRMIHNFLVAEITEDCVLGLDFLKAHNCQVDLERGIITVNGTYAPFRRENEEDESDAKDFFFPVVTVQENHILPSSEAVVWVKLVGYNGKRRNGVVEPVGSQAAPGVLIAKVLTDSGSDGTIPLRVMLPISQKQSVEVWMLRAGRVLSLLVMSLMFRHHLLATGAVNY